MSKTGRYDAVPSRSITLDTVDSIVQAEINGNTIGDDPSLVLRCEGSFITSRLVRNGS